MAPSFLGLDLHSAAPSSLPFTAKLSGFSTCQKRADVSADARCGAGGPPCPPYPDTDSRARRRRQREVRGPEGASSRGPWSAFGRQDRKFLASAVLTALPARPGPPAGGLECSSRRGAVDQRRWEAAELARKRHEAVGADRQPLEAAGRQRPERGHDHPARGRSSPAGPRGPRLPRGPRVLGARRPDTAPMLPGRTDSASGTPGFPPSRGRWARRLPQRVQRQQGPYSPPELEDEDSTRVSTGGGRGVLSVPRGHINSSPSSHPDHSSGRPPTPPPLAPGPSVTEYRLDGHTISDLSRSSRGELIPISPSTEVGGLGIGTPPSVLKRQKKRRVVLSPVTENSASLSFLDSCNSLTPKSTPGKTLPFSPSQCLNFWNKQDTLELESPSLTSTLVCSQKVVVKPLHLDKTPLHQKHTAFVTPDQKYSMDNTPHTPTRFKNALEKYGPRKPFQTPHLEEDLKEVLHSEADIELITEDEERPEKQKRKAGLRRSPIKKVRKSCLLAFGQDAKLMSTLPKVLSLPTHVPSGSSSLNLPGVKGDNSLLNEGFLQAKPEKLVTSQKPLTKTCPMTSTWKTVACGGTRDQLLMQEKARQLLGRLKPSHTSQTLILS
ncbi:LOW QUALITY PROTEIN: myb-related protein B-like [Molossus nigricans]